MHRFSRFAVALVLVAAASRPVGPQSDGIGVVDSPARQSTMTELSHPLRLTNARMDTNDVLPDGKHAPNPVI